MKTGQSARIVRAFQKWTGLALIFLVGVKLVSGLALAGAVEFVGDRFAGQLHFSNWVDAPLFVAFSFHAFYGLHSAFRRSLRRPDAAFIAASVLAVLLSVFGLIILY